MLFNNVISPTDIIFNDTEILFARSYPYIVKMSENRFILFSFVWGTGTYATLFGSNSGSIWEISETLISPYSRSINWAVRINDTNIAFSNITWQELVVFDIENDTFNHISVVNIDNIRNSTEYPNMYLTPTGNSKPVSVGDNNFAFIGLQTPYINGNSYPKSLFMFSVVYNTLTEKYEVTLMWELPITPKQVFEDTTLVDKINILDESLVCVKSGNEYILTIYYSGKFIVQNIWMYYRDYYIISSYALNGILGDNYLDVKNAYNDRRRWGRPDTADDLDWLCEWSADAGQFNKCFILPYYHPFYYRVSAGNMGQGKAGNQFRIVNDEWKLSDRDTPTVLESMFMNLHNGAISMEKANLSYPLLISVYREGYYSSVEDREDNVMNSTAYQHKFCIFRRSPYFENSAAKKEIHLLDESTSNSTYLSNQSTNMFSDQLIQLGEDAVLIIYEKNGQIVSKIVSGIN